MLHKVVLVSLCALAVVSALTPAHELVAQVNLGQTSWTAQVSPLFAEHTEVELKRYFGTRSNALVRATLPRVEHDDDLALPASFDARTQWPGCIGPVLNQADCGSCWAFAAIESVSDRLCINKRVPSFVQLSALDLVTCDSDQGGCDGGDPESAWQWIQGKGLTTETCMPYLQSNGGPVPTCPPAQQPCLNFVPTPACPKSCKDGSKPTQRYHTTSTYSISGEQDYMAELVKNGPIEVAFTVFADFVHYQSGVYTHTTGDMLGGHAVKIIGYGTENGIDYWLVQNSWTTTWGDGGYFKIKRGNDECGIEDSGVAGAV